MTVLKPAGADLHTDQQRDVRRGVIEAGKIVRGRALDAAKAAAVADATAELAALGPVRDLDAADYQQAKRAVLKLMRRVDRKP
jgi:hypothetical protein